MASSSDDTDVVKVDCCEQDSHADSAGEQHN